MLVFHPEIEKKVRNEIEKYVPSMEDLTYENMKKMTYMDNLQNEITRYCGPGGFIFYR